MNLNETCTKLKSTFHNKRKHWLETSLDKDLTDSDMNHYKKINGNYADNDICSRDIIIKGLREKGGLNTKYLNEINEEIENS